MVPKFKNIVIFVTILLVLFGGYFFFLKGDSADEANLVSEPNTTLPDIIGEEPRDAAESSTSLVAKDFLTLLLNVKNIKLNDAIFSDETFLSLRDSSIVLIPDGNEGRPNPFAQFGNDAVPLVPPPSAPTVSQPQAPTP